MGVLETFIAQMGQTCTWTVRVDDTEEGGTIWEQAARIPCIYKGSKQVVDGRTGGAIITPASFSVQARYSVSTGDRIEFRGRTYIVEETEDIDWFGGAHEGYKCYCKQEGGVAR